MNDVYAIAAFRSRQQVLRFEEALRRADIPASIVTTPRAVALGCGLSVKFDLENIQRVKAVLKGQNTGNLIGLYRVRYAGGRAEISPIPR